MPTDGGRPGRVFVLGAYPSALHVAWTHQAQPAAKGSRPTNRRPRPNPTTRQRPRRPDDRVELLAHLQTPAAVGGHEFGDWPIEQLVGSLGGDLATLHDTDHIHFGRTPVTATPNALAELASFGRDEGAKQTFYGLRTHLRVCWPGVITDARLLPANLDDLTMAEELLVGVQRLGAGRPGLLEPDPSRNPGQPGRGCWRRRPACEAGIAPAELGDPASAADQDGDRPAGRALPRQNESGSATPGICVRTGKASCSGTPWPSICARTVARLAAPDRPSHQLNAHTGLATVAVG
jgi:hypothetical protein